MRSVVHTRQGDPAEVLELREEDGRPRPGAGEVLVRLRVRPVHPGDLIAVEGGLPGLPDQDSQPRIPGVEGMGVVEEAGADVRAPLVGRRVAVFPAPGAWAEYVVVPAERAVPVPDEIGDDTAALMLVNPLTLVMLHRAVEQALDGHDGPVVQTAAGSSVGRLVSAHAERHGLPLVNLVRGAAGARKVRDVFPGQPVIVTSDADWQDQVRRATGGGGARAVLDCVGGSLTRDLVGLLGDGGTLISYGRLGSGVTMLDELPLVNRGLTVRGVTIWHWTDRTPEQRAEDLAFAVDLARTSPELLEVAARYDLADVKAAVKHARRPGKSGTVLLTSPAETGGAR
ncbi:alcohol dehydrogenase catalytic domain-containing protein [Streptomyces pseudogriseolus]|uniref:alcohol dehydrogenase catalytic domain-containing protein n=1 Tax=Streptomyces pseudogriseolus TaxID=36817 RepID=UPI003FA2C2FC|nr:zinc-binding dehydrogenase [Streptomyces pseudogriseolus]